MICVYMDGGGNQGAYPWFPPPVQWIAFFEEIVKAK